MNNAGFGSIYSLATLSSAFLLPYFGRLIDFTSLKKYSLFVTLGLITASLLMTYSPNLLVLGIAILILRLSGQGLSGHTAETAMARYYSKQRGKALSISSLGYAFGEGLLPIIIAVVLGYLSWRMTWGSITLAIIILFVPFMLYTVAHVEKAEDIEKKKEKKSTYSAKEVYKIVLKKPFFWIILPAVLMPPFWATALFLYQISVADQLGWSATLIASAFVFFALTRIFSSISIGPLIDKFTAKKLFPFYLIPFGLGLITAYFHIGAWSAYVYMAFLGVTLGVGSSIKSALWAELYGTEIVGTVRSLLASVMIFSTALSPFLMGWLLDRGTDMTYILGIAIICVVVTTLLSFMAFLLRKDDTGEQLEIN